MVARHQGDFTAPYQSVGEKFILAAAKLFESQHPSGSAEPPVCRDMRECLRLSNHNGAVKDPVPPCKAHNTINYPDENFLSKPVLTN